MTGQYDGNYGRRRQIKYEDDKNYRGGGGQANAKAMRSTGIKTKQMRGADSACAPAKVCAKRWPCCDNARRETRAQRDDSMTKSMQP